MKNRIYLLMTAFGVIMFSCSRNAETSMSEPNAATADVAAARLASAPLSGRGENTVSQLIRTVQYRFEAKDVAKTTEAIAAAVKKYPAYISESSLHQQNSLLENRISIRVQHDYFDALMKEIDREATFVNFREIKTDDVTREFVDLESRLKTKRRVEERYIDILRNKAGTIEELLDAERQIGGLQEEIEATISRINYLHDQVAYSTVNLEYYQVIPHRQLAGDEETFAQRFHEAGSAGWDGMVTIFISLTYIWPLIVTVLGTLVAVRARNIIRLRSYKS